MIKESRFNFLQLLRTFGLARGFRCSPSWFHFSGRISRLRNEGFLRTKSNADVNVITEKSQKTSFRYPECSTTWNCTTYAACLLVGCFRVAHCAHHDSPPKERKYERKHQTKGVWVLEPFFASSSSCFLRNEGECLMSSCMSLSAAHEILVALITSCSLDGHLVL